MHLVLATTTLLALHSGAPSGAEPSATSEPVARPVDSAAGMEAGRPATLFFGDVDGDGLDDVFAIGAGGEPSLMLNRGGGRYEDITLPSGLATLEFATCALLADVDGDGDLDLFVGSSETRVWLNLGNALFEPISSGIDHDLVDLAASAIDRDGDGLVDLQIQTEAGDLLYRNTGRGAFERVALIEPQAARSTAIGGTPVADAALPTDADVLPGDEPPARRRQRRWLDARIRNATAPSSAAPTTTPGSTGGASPLLATCTPWIQDQATTTACLFASSAPTLGMLYPMSTALNVDATGRVGIGTVTPTSALTVVAQNSSNISALSGNNGVHAGINVGRTAGEFAMGISSSNGNWLAGSAPGDGILRVNDSTRKILLGFGIGGPATMAVTSGRVGIGTVSPTSVLTVVAANEYNIAALSENSSVPAGITVGRTASEFSMGISAGVSNWFAGSAVGDGALRVADSSKRILLGVGIANPTVAVTNGKVGINTTTPSSNLEVYGTAYRTVSVRGSNNSSGAEVYFDKTAAGAQHAASIGYEPSNGMYLWANGAYRLTIDQAGLVSVKQSLEIRGGADIVERFESSCGELEPGTVVSIDPAHPGRLACSSGAYDTKVAGVVSGAGGIEPGLCLSQDGVLDGDTLVAMNGRVYVKCSAENGAIQPGDRLTTAKLPGHAMKVSDEPRSVGAVIGKAMTALDEGEGLVLVLVNLQ